MIEYNYYRLKEYNSILHSPFEPMPYCSFHFHFLPMPRHSPMPSPTIQHFVYFAGSSSRRRWRSQQKRLRQKISVLGIYRLMFVFEPFARYHFPRRVISNPFVVCFKFTTFAVTSFFICYWMRKSPGVSANVCEAVGRDSFLFTVNCFILPDKSHHQRVNMSILFDRILLIVP